MNGAFDPALLLHALGESSPLPTYAVDREGRVIFAGRAFARLLRHEPSALLGRTAADLLDPEDAVTMTAGDRLVLDAGEGLERVEKLRLQRFRREFRLRRTPLRDASGALVGVLAVIVDAIPKSFAERRLVVREQRVQRAMKACAGIVYEWSPRSGSARRREGLERVIGVAAADAEPTAQWWRDRIHPDDLALILPAIEKQIAAGANQFESEYRMRHADGRWLTLWDRAVVERGRAGEVLRVTGNVIDVSARREAEDRLRLAAEATGAGLCEADLRLRTIRLDETSGRLLGLPSDRAVTIDEWRAVIEPEDRAAVDARLRRLIENDGGQDVTESVEYRVRGEDGAQRWLHDTARRQHDADGALTSLLISIQDISVRRRTEAGLREAEQRFRLLVENLDDVFWIVDWRTRRQLYVSPGYERCWGYPPSALYQDASRWMEHIHADDRMRVASAFESLTTAPAGEDHFAVEYRIGVANGELRWIRDRGIAVRNAEGGIERVVGIAEDITDRRTVVRSLREREQGLQLALEAAELQVWTLNVATRALDISEVLCAIFGLTPRTCRRLGPWRRRLHRNDRERVEKALRSLIQTGAPLSEEFRVEQPGGAAVSWLSVRAALSLDDPLRPRVYGVATDITARKHEQQALADSERELRTITAALPIGINRISRDRRYLFANEALAANLLDTTPDRIIGREMREVVGEAAYAQISSRHDEVLSGRHVDYEVSLQLPRGYRCIHVTYVPEFDDRGEVTSFVSVIEDVTERKLAEAKVYEREREFKMLAENAPDIIARVDRDLAYLYINRAAERVFGVMRDRVGERRAAQLGFPHEYVGATSAAVVEVFERSLEQTTSFSVEQGSEHRHFVARAIPELDRLGLVESVLLIVYDVSDRVRTQIERDSLLVREHEARELAEAAARGRDEFLAIVSHELRSPLNGIQSWAHVLESSLGDASKVAVRAVAGIKTGVEQQVRLINDLLDATRIMSGKLSLNLTPLKLQPVLLDAVESVLAKAVQKSVTIETDLQLDGESIDGDIDRVQQIVWNLLSNAIKFTPSGGHVWIRATRDGASAVIAVRDDGRGIDADFLPHLFERFRRDETGNSRGQDGLGLGLMLVRHLSELHRGSVSATSEGAGRGATFTVRLPLHGVTQAPSEEAIVKVGSNVMALPLPSLRGLHVLLVDDHVESRDALAMLLVQAGAEVDVLSSGEDAVHRIEENNPALQPDVLICDIAMPTKDGYETLREIRAHERRTGQARLPAIALTAFAQNEDRVRALNAGFEMHISKPVPIEELIVTIAAFARHRADSQAS